MISDKPGGCRLCPRQCNAKRDQGVKGVCGTAGEILVARAALHMWEEPCISGTKGSGTVFFSGCPLRCSFCQNREISDGSAGKAIDEQRLTEIFLELQEKGAANINLVTAGHYADRVARALSEAKRRGLAVPIVWNSGGYELPETLSLVADLVDIWLPDFKFFSKETAARYAKAPDYPEIAAKAIAFMAEKAGPPVFDGEGYMKRGMIVRHLVLPGHRKEAEDIIRYLYETYGDRIYLSIMNQYTPPKEKLPEKELNRKLTRYEYDRTVAFAMDLGITNAYIQEGETAKESFIPPFTGEGV